MAKTKISEYSATPADNTDISNINIAEGCSPANVNNAIRSLMAQIKDLQAGTSGDTIPLTAGGTGSTTATAARTTLSAAKSGANSDITSLTACTSITGLTTPLTTAQGGTGTASTTFANLTTNVTGTLPVANGGTGLATLTANNVMLGNGTSAPSFVAPSTSGNVLTSNGTTWISQAIPTMTFGTSQATTSGTTVDITGIPSTAKRVTFLFKEVSTNGSSIVQIQLGTSGGFQTSGYSAAASNSGGGSTTGMPISQAISSSDTRHGGLVLSKIDGNTWVGYGSGCVLASFSQPMAGYVTLSGALTSIRLTTINGTDTFDAGLINIIYE